MKKYDVIVVGAGPSGMAASKILKDNNINFCLIDKKKFPREKLCAGGLTNKSIKLLKELNINLNNINKKQCKKTLLFSKEINKTIYLDNEIIMIDRIEFDYNCIQQIGIDNFYQEENIIDIQDNTVITDKDTYEFKYIIFADGVNGYSRKFINNRQFGFCVEYKLEKEIDEIILDFSAIKDGYGWFFPKQGHTTIGLGNFTKEKSNYIECLYSFAKKHHFKIDKLKIRGYHIPIYSKKIYHQSVIDNRYILTGDAASLVDSVSGEGIYYALLSGKMASESIIECIHHKKDLKKVYFRKTKEMYHSLNKRNFLNKLLYSKHNAFFIKLGLSKKCFIKKINKVFG